MGSLEVLAQTLPQRGLKAIDATEIAIVAGIGIARLLAEQAIERGFRGFSGPKGRSMPA